MKKGMKLAISCVLVFAVVSLIPSTTKAPVSAQVTSTAPPATTAPPQESKYPMGWAMWNGNQVYNQATPGDLCCSCVMETLYRPRILVDHVELVYNEEFEILSGSDVVVIKQSVLDKLPKGQHYLDMIYDNNVTDVMERTNLYIISQKPDGNLPEKEGTSIFSATGAIYVQNLDNRIIFSAEEKLNITNVYINNHKLRSKNYNWDSDRLCLYGDYLKTLKIGTYYLRVQLGDREEILPIEVVSRDAIEPVIVPC